jgi:hypothetical protein
MTIRKSRSKALFYGRCFSGIEISMPRRQFFKLLFEAGGESHLDDLTGSNLAHCGSDFDRDRVFGKKVIFFSKNSFVSLKSRFGP